MAPLPPESTARFWLDYTDGVNEHAMLFRYAPSAGLAAIQLVANQFLQGLEPELFLISVLGARAAATGSVISSAVVWTGDSSYGDGIATQVNSPLELCFVGRTSGGRMAKWFVYGYKHAVPGSYRFVPGENANLDAAVGVLRTAALAGTLLAIDGLPPSVYPYVNIQYNSYWETQQRR